MKKLFISQPMKGRTNEDITKEREEAIEYVEGILGEKVQVLESFFEDAPVDSRPLYYLSKSIELLSLADIVYFALNWEYARGCRIEHLCAEEYGIEILED